MNAASSFGNDARVFIILHRLIFNDSIESANNGLRRVNEYDWFNPASVSRDAQGVPTGVPAGTTLVRTTTNSYHNAATSAGSANVYAKRNLTTAEPIILNAMQESITGASKAQVSYDGQAYGAAPTLGNVTKQASWDNHSSKWLNTNHSYDSFGNRISTTDPRGKVTQFVFGDSTKANVTQIIVDPQNGTGQQTTNIAYDFSTGLVTSQTDPNGQSTTTSYTNQLTFAVDPFGRPGIVTGPMVSSTVGATTYTNQRRQTKSLYRDNARQVEVISDLNTQGDGLLKSRTSSDQIGRVTLSEASENGSSYTITTKNVYKYRQSPNKGTITFTTNPYRSASATTDGWTRATTDEIGRVERVETFSGGPVTQPPDEGTNANSTGSVVTTYNGEQTTVRDQANKQRRSTLDGLGRLVKVEEMNEFPSSTVYATTNYSYDVLGNLTSVAQGSQTRTFTYDSLSRLKSATNPESATIAYNYDDNSNLTSKIDARAITTTYLYDSLNRVTSRSYTDGTPAVTYTYDAIGVANSKGRLTQVSSSVSSYSYDGYDAEGKLTQSTQMTDGQAYLMNYAYNLAGAMTKETYPSGRVVTTNYDAAGRLSSVVGVKSGVTTTYTSQYSYSAHGAALSFKLGNNLFEHTNFNSRLQPTQIGLGTTSTSISVLGLNYTYGTSNNNGNILTQQIIAPNLNTTQSYSYDQVNRLLVAQENSGSNWKQTFTYDVYGNRRFDAANTTANVLGPNPTISTTNNRINASGYIYDSAGNMTAEPGKSYQYDGENRQKNYNSGAATYHYDGDGRRVKKVVGTVTTWFVYNASGQMIAEYESPAPSSSGGTSYLTTDHLGSTRVVTDSAGMVKTRRDYLPFGEEIASSIGGRTAAGGYGQADGIDQKFTGKERDAESGLDYFLARYYSSAQGRFTGADPLYFQFEMVIDPQRFNLYVYTRNNPLKFVDPSGERLFLGGDIAFLTVNVLYQLAGGQNEFDQNFEIVNNEVILKAGVDTSKFNAGQRELLGLIQATEIYLFYAGTDGEDAANLFQNTRDRRGNLNRYGRNLANEFTGNNRDRRGGSLVGTSGRRHQLQPANLANGDPVFAVIAYNTRAEFTQTAVSFDYSEANMYPRTAYPVAFSSQLEGVGQRIQPVSFFVHEATENREFSRIGVDNYDRAHTYAMRREAAIRQDLGITGGFSGGVVQRRVP